MNLEQVKERRMRRSIVILLGLLSSIIFSGIVECSSRKERIMEEFDYSAINCRKHTAILTDFGGVGDGQTSNTKAFQSAIDSLTKFQSDGGSQLFVPPGKWLTGSFNLISHFTLYLHKDAVILASQDVNNWPMIEPLPSYGRSKDMGGLRYKSLIFGTNLTDVIITGNNGTINGQGALWWEKLKSNSELKSTRPRLIEIIYSNQIQISNLILTNSPSWHVHPVYSSNVVVQGLTILAPPTSPNTDGINPDSCTNVRIQDCYIVSGDDCVSVKSGWDEYGIKFGMPSKHIIIRRLTCTSPNNAVLTLGSEMSGGIQDVRVEDIVAISTESGVRIKTTVGRGGYVKDIFLRRMSIRNMRWVFIITGNYNTHPDDKYDHNALPLINGVSFSDIVATNVRMAGKLEGMVGNPFTGICISNVTMSLGPKALTNDMWECSDVKGSTKGVTPKPCNMLSEQNANCPFPEDILPIDRITLKKCSIQKRN